MNTYVLSDDLHLKVPSTNHQFEINSWLKKIEKIFTTMGIRKHEHFIWDVVPMSDT